MKNSDLKFLEKVMLESKKSDNISSLNIFAWIFYAMSIIIVLYAIIILIQGELEFGYENDTMLFMAYIVGAVLISSWGALLNGIDNIVKNTSAQEE